MSLFPRARRPPPQFYSIGAFVAIVAGSAVRPRSREAWFRLLQATVRPDTPPPPNHRSQADVYNRKRLFVLVTLLGEVPCLCTFFVRTYWRVQRPRKDRQLT